MQHVIAFTLTSHLFTEEKLVPKPLEFQKQGLMFPVLAPVIATRHTMIL